VQDRLAQRRTQLHELEDNPNTPLPTANEGQLNIARGELRTAYAGLEQLTIRAHSTRTSRQRRQSRSRAACRFFRTFDQATASV
jgi:hypothetical protein